MELKVVQRSAEKKREAKRLLRNGSIPAILYSRGKQGESIAVDEAEFGAVLRKVLPGRLSTTIFSLVDSKGKARRAIVKEIQYHVTSYEVTHLDFEELVDNQKVNVKIPVEFTSMAECVGVKLGGFLRQVIRSVRVECLPKDIPQVFELDVKEMGIRQYKKVSDLTIPPTVKPLVDTNEVVVVIAKR